MSSVHSTHCCVKHGCKYGDQDCPVELKIELQEFPCETCQWADELKQDVLEDIESRNPPMLFNWLVLNSDGVVLDSCSSKGEAIDEARTRWETDPDGDVPTVVRVMIVEVVSDEEWTDGEFDVDVW